MKEHINTIGLLFVAVVLSVVIILYNAYYIPDIPPATMVYAPSLQAEGESREGTQTQVGENTAQTATDSVDDFQVTVIKININTATSEELQELPGIGPVLAQRIIDYRTQDGFNSIEEIKNVKGIGDATFEKLRNFIAI